MMHVRALLALSTLALIPAALAQRPPPYSGPQAVVYLNAGGEFGDALLQTMGASKYFRLLRREDGADLKLQGDAQQSGGGGGVCLPFVGCVGATMVTATVELTDAATGAVLLSETCQGSSANYSTWGYWYGGFNASTGTAQAAADCAGQLTNKLTQLAALKPYLKLAPGAPIPANTAATAPTAPAANAFASQTDPAVVAAFQPVLVALATLDGPALNAALTSDLLSGAQLAALAAATPEARGKAAVQVAGLRLVSTVALGGGQPTLGTFSSGAGSSVLGVAPGTGGAQKVLYYPAADPRRAGLADPPSRGLEELVTAVLRAAGVPGF